MSKLPNAHRFLSLFLALAVMAMCACTPAPDRELSEAEKTADMMWLFSIFDQNYAPRTLKEQNFGFDYETLKTEYLAEAVNTTDNEAFYTVMHRFVAEFQDPHTSSMLAASSLPGRTEIAFLGFNGVRMGDTLEVTELLPTTANSTSFPVQVGDRIVKLDGFSLRTIILEEMTEFRSLGNDESNLTFHMNGLFTRSPLVQPLPTAADAVLTIERGGDTREITLPWVRKDLTEFLDQQRAATGDPNATIAGIDAKKYLEAASTVLAGADISTLDIPIAGLPGVRSWNYFKFIDNMPNLTSASVVAKVRNQLRAEQRETMSAVEDTRAYLSSVRNIPFGAIILEESTTFPAYIAKFPTQREDEPVRFYGYLLLDTFSPDTAEEGAVAELSALLTRFESLGVKHLVIDTINNGGGSLTFGMKAAQVFSKNPLELPLIQFKLSETWIDNFQSQSLFGPSDAERELARRVFEDLKAARDAGALLSEAMPIDVLMPFQFIDGNPDMPEMEVTLLVNEMCVSMCDIFAAVLKDNGLATVIGKKTMGGGGNVVQYAQAPNSNLAVAQTESLILRANGQAIENDGIEPDVELEVHESAAAKYDPVREHAVELLNPCDANCVPTDDLGGRGDNHGGCSASTGSAGGLAALLLLGAIAVTRRRKRADALV